MPRRLDIPTEQIQAEHAEGATVRALATKYACSAGAIHVRVYGNAVRKTRAELAADVARLTEENTQLRKHLATGLLLDAYNGHCTWPEAKEKADRYGVATEFATIADKARGG